MSQQKTTHQDWNTFWSFYPQQQNLLPNLQNVLCYNFITLDLLYEALTHRSSLHCINKILLNKKNKLLSLPWNEKLEFLGDAVLQLSISSLIWQYKTDLNEGGMSRLRAKLVSKTSLVTIAKHLQLEDYIALDQNSDLYQQESILANCLEGIFGAIYLDGGYEAAKDAIHKIYIFCYGTTLDNSITDYKSQLQEVSQRWLKTTPKYLTIESSGPEHKKNYNVGVYLLNKQIASAWGKSKKIASQKAADFALQNIPTTKSTKIIEQFFNHLKAEHQE
jgi:ribonuclease III